MCGIAGLFGRSDPALAKAMAQAIRQRGPDDEGIYVGDAGEVLLVHRRLAIQDLSSAGHQPMVDATGRYVICYNGEVYNHAELRPAIEADGHVFRGHSDTETILEAYARRGPEIFGELNGIFALAIWDRKDRVLTLVRDGMGVKPLYWSDTPQGLAFSSEIKALLAVPSLERTVDPVAARAYLTYLWSPGERTLFKAVKKLAPGSWLRIAADNTRTTGCFYKPPPYQPDAGMTDAQAIDGTRDALGRAVERQMLSDVEVGAFLSGGLDSSAIIHFARDHVNGRIPCFTISHNERPGEAGEFIPDLPYARKAAKHLGVDLYEVEVSSAMATDLEKMVYLLDEPQPDLAALNNLYISTLARSHGIKVLLSGAGADDVFTGYRRHLAATADRRIGAVPAWVREGAVRAARHLPGQSASMRRVRKMAEIMRGDSDQRLMRSFEWLARERVERLFSEPLADIDEVRAPLQEVLDDNRGQPAVERLLRIDQKFFLTDHNLNYTDKTGMAVGVEIRVPFLDPDLMDWASRLPLKTKIRDWQTKWVLRKAMEGRLPHDVIYRPKTGFGVPLRSWLKNELREMLETLTEPSVLKNRGLFDSVEVSRLKQDTFAGMIDATYTLLGLMVIELWFRRFVDVTVGAPQEPALVGF